MAPRLYRRLTVHGNDNNIVFIDAGGQYTGHNWQGEIARSYDLTAVELALCNAPKPRPKPRLGLEKPKKLNDGVPPVPSDVLTLMDEGSAIRKGKGENATALAIAYKTSDGRIIAATGEKSVACATPSEARAKAAEALRGQEARKRKERKERNARLRRPPEESPEGEL